MKDGLAGLNASIHSSTLVPIDASIRCEAGEILALVGPSGSGKTTILRSIAGSQHPDAGTVTVNGQTWFDSDTNVHIPTYKRSLGMVFQGYALFPHLSALENIAAALYHLPKSQRLHHARCWMNRVNMSGLENARPSELSGGQRQRVAVARALSREADLLLLDEPFSAVDKATRDRLHQELRALLKESTMPVVLVTHDLDEAAILADKLVVLHHGRTLQSGSVQSITTRPNSTTVARLVNLRNVFPGVVLSSCKKTLITRIQWANKVVVASCYTQITPGTPISWVIPDEFVVRESTRYRANATKNNSVTCTLTNLHTQRETTQITSLPLHDVTLPVNFSIPTRKLAELGYSVGMKLTLNMLAEGIHIIDGD